MFERYKIRMAHRGANISEVLRAQSNIVIEHTWERDPNYRMVYVVRAHSGLPEVTYEHELVDAKFNVDTYQKEGSDEPAYHIQFRHGAEKLNPDIGVGAYVYIPDEDDEWKWWLITGLDERPQFRQYTISECNWKFGWVSGGKIYYHLGVLRSGNKTRGVDAGSYISVVDSNLLAWMATNADTRLIDHGNRFLISDDGRKTPLCFGVGGIIDTLPVGITKLSLNQQTFDPAHDNAELMLADYYDSAILPDGADVAPEENGSATITYSGVSPTIKVGGSFKTFTPSFSSDGVAVDKWLVSCNGVDISGDPNYTIEYVGDKLKIKVAQNYSLIGTVLNIQLVGSDHSMAQLSVEVV